MVYRGMIGHTSSTALLLLLIILFNLILKVSFSLPDQGVLVRRALNCRSWRGRGRVAENHHQTGIVSYTRGSNSPGGILPKDGCIGDLYVILL